MNNLSTRFYIPAIVAGLATSFAAQAFCQEAIYSTFGAGSTFNTNSSVQFGPGIGYADRFTSPITAEVGSASLALQAAAVGDAITLTIRSNSASGPDGIVGTFNSATISTDPGIVTFTSTSSFQLNAGTRYWLTAFASGGQINWFLDDQNIDNFKAVFFADHWQVDQIGTIGLGLEIDAVPEPSSLALGAVGLLACFRRRYINYAHIYYSINCHCAGSVVARMYHAGVGDRT